MRTSSPCGITSPQWGPANLKQKHRLLTVFLSRSGEGGIRTREPLWVTRFPSVRAVWLRATNETPSYLHCILYRLARYIFSANAGGVKVEKLSAPMPIHCPPSAAWRDAAKRCGPSRLAVCPFYCGLSCGFILSYIALFVSNRQNKTGTRPPFCFGFGRACFPMMQRGKRAACAVRPGIRSTIPRALVALCSRRYVWLVLLVNQGQQARIKSGLGRGAGFYRPPARAGFGILPPLISL